MAVTRSTLAERAQNPHHPMEARGRVWERVFLLLTLALIFAAVNLAGTKMARVDGSGNERLNLSTLDRREELLPFLQWVSSPAQRQYLAGNKFEGVRSGEGSVSTRRDRPIHGASVMC